MAAIWQRGLGRRCCQSQSLCGQFDSTREGQLDHRSWVGREVSFANPIADEPRSWELERCVGQTGAIPRVGFRSMCMQDGPLGLRFSESIRRENTANHSTNMVQLITTPHSLLVSTVQLPGLAG